MLGRCCHYGSSDPQDVEAWVLTLDATLPDEARKRTALLGLDRIHSSILLPEKGQSHWIDNRDQDT